MAPYRRFQVLLYPLYIAIIVQVFFLIKSHIIRQRFLTESRRDIAIATVPKTIYSNNFISKQVGDYEYPTANKSKTKPPYYPLNGTGQTVNIWGDFDVERFNDFCVIEKDLVAVIPVYSAPGNFERRKAIRETVGKTCSQLRCKIFFIVGVSLDKTIYKHVKDEHFSMKDILIIDKVDTYRDLNNKVVAMLDWLINCCRGPKYVIHIIDDFYPNLKMIIERLNTIKISKFVLGFVHGRARVLRKKTSKWYISEDEYPYKKYLPFHVGVVYAFRNNESAFLRRRVHAVEYCWIEDVWFTGHVRQGAGFVTVKLNKYLPNVDALRDWKNVWELYSGIHQINSTDFYVIHNHTPQT